MPLTLIEGPKFLPVTKPEMEDVLGDSSPATCLLVGDATKWIEFRMMAMFNIQRWLWRYPRPAANTFLQIPVAPIRRVEAVVAGNTPPPDADDWSLVTKENRYGAQLGALVFSDWISLFDAETDIYVRLECGFGLYPEDVPEDIRAEILATTKWRLDNLGTVKYWEVAPSTKTLIDDWNQANMVSWGDTGAKQMLMTGV